MHNGVKDYLKSHADKVQGKILDVGSLNVSGEVRGLFPTLTGVDMRPGPGVDLECKGEDLPLHFSEGHFDTIITCDTLEHVENWRDFLRGCWHVLKMDGWFLVTIADRSKGRHAYPDDYWRLDEGLAKRIFPDAQDIRKVGVSFGWVVQKKTPLIPGDIDSFDLYPVDNKVPKALLKCSSSS